MMRRVRTLLAGLLPLIAIGALTTTNANAQDTTVEFTTVEPGVGSMIEDQSMIPASRVRQFVRLLDLDEPQTEAVWALHEAYTASMREAGAKMQEAISALQPSQINLDEDGNVESAIAIGDEWGKAFAEFGERARVLQEEFMGDVKLLLTEEQAGNWVRVERARRRGEMLRINMVSGDSVDLVELTDELDLEPEVAVRVEPVILRYEAELDRVLEPAERKGREMEEKMRERMEDEGGGMMGAFDPEMMREGMKLAVDMVLNSKKINDRYARLIEAELPEEPREAFVASVKAKSFPRVYRPTHAQRVLEAADRMDDLDDSQREQIATIFSAYQRDRASANDAWAHAIEADELDEDGNSMLAMLRKMAEGDDQMGFMAFAGIRESEDVTKTRDARKAVDERAIQRVHDVLAQEQLERLPDAPEQDEFGGMFNFQMMAP